MSSTFRQVTLDEWDRRHVPRRGYEILMRLHRAFWIDEGTQIACLVCKVRYVR